MRVSVVLPHAVEDVFALLSEPARRPEWQGSLRAVELLTDGPTGVGTRLYDVTAVPGVRPLMEITEHEPNRSWAEVGAWGGVRGRLRMQFEGRTDARGSPETMVSVTATVEAGSWRRPLAWVLALLGPPAIRSDLRRAGRVLADRPM